MQILQLLGTKKKNVCEYNLTFNNKYFTATRYVSTNTIDTLGRYLFIVDKCEKSEL